MSFEDEDEYYYECDEAEEENYEKLYNIRNKIYEILEQDIPYEEKIQCIVNLVEDDCDEKISLVDDNKILLLYEKTEPINVEWTEYVESLKRYIDEIQKNEKPFDEMSNGDRKYSKILSYVIFRHLMKSVFSDNLSFIAYLNFCISSVRFIKLCDIKTYIENGSVRKIDRINNIKRWSKQIEYSDENMDLLTDI